MSIRSVLYREKLPHTFTAIQNMFTLDYDPGQQHIVLLNEFSFGHRHPGEYDNTVSVGEDGVFHGYGPVANALNGVMERSSDFPNVWFFMGSTILSTALSGAFSVSLWGEVPGQDGYAAYTMVAYALLFGVIATHMKTKAQLWRLVGAIVVMGTLVGTYAIFQHYVLDFLGLTEPSGGGTQRVTAFMGNSIFAAAVMVMTIPISLVAATESMSRFGNTSRRSLNSPTDRRARCP